MGLVGNCTTSWSTHKTLDWTKSPLVAAYFALRNGAGIKDAVIYIIKEDLPTIDISEDPFSIKSNGFFKPRYLSSRISAQNGVFTIHNNPEEIFDTLSLERVLIKKECQIELKITLAVYNIHEFSVFPDLNGLAKRLTGEYIGGTFSE